jgi:transcriptional regulator with XRE-family HTH domain
MAKWKPLEDYSPFARLLVEYMWEQRPPLLPNQFAQRMGIRKQQVSSWLNSDATPSPLTLMRLARGMGRPVSELFIAANAATPADPLFDLEETWTHVLAEVQETPEFQALAEPQRIIVVGVLHAAHIRDRVAHSAQPGVSNQVDGEPDSADDVEAPHGAGVDNADV